MATSLTLAELQQAMQMRVRGKTYADIAEHFGVPNTGALHVSIREYLKTSVESLGMSYDLVLALDLARADEMLSPMMEGAIEDKSPRHADAAVKIMRLKMDIIQLARELIAERAALQGTQADDATFKVDDELYEEAMILANDALAAGAWEPDRDEVYLGAEELSEEELDMLESQLIDLESSIDLVDEDGDGRTADF